MKLLIVENSKVVRERLLEMLGHRAAAATLLEADSVENALSQLLTHEPDLVLLDLGLADGHGFEALIRLKAHRPATPVWVMSLNAGEHYRKFALKRGADRFFDKIKDYAAMIEAISAQAAVGRFEDLLRRGSR